MKRTQSHSRRLSLLLPMWAMAFLLQACAQKQDPLSTWREGPAKTQILEFVAAVTTPGSNDFVPEPERIAVFDNDGTLWSEQPLYFQFVFAIDQVKVLAPQHPEWNTTPPFKAVIEGDMRALMASGEHGLLEIMMATHAGSTTEEFATVVRKWIDTSLHPKFDRPYTELVYQPMLQLMTYLRSQGFKTFIVSGGGIEFMRVFAEDVYGVPPEQVIGSSIKTTYEVREGDPVILRTPAIDFVDDGPGKPVGIQNHIGRRPIAAFGNSDGDFQMLEWVTRGTGRRFGLIVHHDDAEREFAYDRGSPIGKLERGLDEAAARGWVVASMKTDWASVYSPSVR